MIGNSEGRNVQILESIIDKTEYDVSPQSRIEELLLELKRVIEEGGIDKPVYWMGVTTTVLTDGGTTNPIMINGESKLAKDGGMAQYDGEEFVWNGSAWQSMGKNNLGKLAFADSVEATYTPQGEVSTPTATVENTSKVNVNSMINVGILPQMEYVYDYELLYIKSGRLPIKSDNTSVVSNVGGVSVSQPTFTGSESVIESTSNEVEE